MSMNLELLARREVVVLSSGERTVEEKRIEGLWQTSTGVTLEILESDDPVEAYITWVEEHRGAVDEAIIDDHIKWLRSVVRDLREQGYRIEASMT